MKAIRVSLIVIAVVSVLSFIGNLGRQTPAPPAPVQVIQVPVPQPATIVQTSAPAYASEPAPTQSYVESAPPSQANAVGGFVLGVVAGAAADELIRSQHRSSYGGRYSWGGGQVYGGGNRNSIFRSGSHGPAIVGGGRRPFAGQVFGGRGHRR